MSPATGGERIVVDPDDLRRVATRMRGASVMFSSLGRELAGRPLPLMPAAIEAEVREVVSRTNAELQDLALELLEEAGTLFARAAWAELGGGVAGAWLVPGLQDPQMSSPGSAASLASMSEEQLIRSQGWARSLLDEMADGSPALTQVIDDEVGGLASDLVEFAAEHPDDVVPLGALAMSPGTALDVYESRDASADPAARKGAVGALGAALPEVSLGSSGAGLVGCLLVGGRGAGLPADEVVE